MGRIIINEKKEQNDILVDQKIDWEKYYSDVLTDYREMKEQYPFSYLTILPTIKPELATIRVVATNKDLIEAVGGVETDFLGEYSKELYVIIPIYYQSEGCKVYGGKWINDKRLKKDDIHYYCDRKNKFGFQLCVGIPESFSLMKNVILENVKTAENMLVAYERVMAGYSEKLMLISYAHGDKGRNQFQKNPKKYLPKR